GVRRRPGRGERTDSRLLVWRSWPGASAEPDDDTSLLAVLRGLLQIQIAAGTSRRWYCRGSTRRQHVECVHVHGTWPGCRRVRPPGLRLHREVPDRISGLSVDVESSLHGWLDDVGIWGDVGSKTYPSLASARDVHLGGRSQVGSVGILADGRRDVWPASLRNARGLGACGLCLRDRSGARHRMGLAFTPALGVLERACAGCALSRRLILGGGLVLSDADVSASDDLSVELPRGPGTRRGNAACPGDQVVGSHASRGAAAVLESSDRALHVSWSVGGHWRRPDTRAEHVRC